MRSRIGGGVDGAQIGCGGARIGCGVAVFVVLNVFFFVEEVFIEAFCLVIMTATVRSNWWVVGGGKVFSQVFYTFC